MESTVFINLATFAARATLTGLDAPKAVARLQAHFALIVKFFEPGEDAALLTGSPTFRVAIKGTPTGSPFVFTSTATAQADSYLFEFSSVDSAALRSAIGDLPQLEAFAEVEWTLDGVVERSAFPITILTAYIRSDDDAPDPIAEESVTWLNDQLAARITEEGYFELQNADGDWFHFALNSGRAPG